jgi:predicted dienelactone hydrolase
MSLFTALFTSVRLNRRNSVLHATNKHLNWLGLVLGCCGWLIPTAGISNSALAAERIYASYGALERSISVDALETYAKEGKLDEDLDGYARYLNPQQLAQLRRVLLARIDLSAVAASQFLYTPTGKTLLERLGQVIQTEARQPGFYALRSALILAAADPEGLTLLNVLRKFPTRSIRIDLRRSLQIAEELKNLINQTNQAIALVSQQSTAEINAQPSVNFSQLPDLRRRGRFTWNKRTLTLYDRQRNRRFPADIYLPNTRTPAPVIVISHGLGSDRTSFEYLAAHLATYGFAVAVPEHPGSSAEQLRLLLAGRVAEVAKPNEFINRPLDVQYLLDELQRLDSSDPSFQLNLQQVGVIGQSFGGYTALALAGASLNFDQLQKDCEALNQSWNASLLLQCRVLQLPHTQYNLQDERVKAAIAINPITSSVFGEASLRKIAVPVMIVSSSYDTVAPALAEQILPFTWLTSPEKYLAVIEGGTHFSPIDEPDPTRDPFTLPPQVIGPNPVIARCYMNALSVGFFQTYVAAVPQYRPYLSATYAQVISQAPLDLSFVQSLPVTELTQFVK